MTPQGFIPHALLGYISLYTSLNFLYMDNWGDHEWPSMIARPPRLTGPSQALPLWHRWRACTQVPCAQARAHSSNLPGLAL